MQSPIIESETDKPEAGKQTMALDVICLDLDILESDQVSDEALIQKRMTSTSLSLPPLDEVTTCGSEDDSSSVSSLDSSMSDEDSVPRSIFNVYWERNGGGPSLRRKSCPPQRQKLQDSEDESESSVNTYEQVLKIQESFPAPRSPQGGSRRSIFNQSCWAKSLPELSADGPRAAFRKTQSTSALLCRKPRHSCLRRGRFSCSEEKRGASVVSDSSVRFDTEVKVAVFQRPAENWAPKQWSSFFSD